MAERVIKVPDIGEGIAEVEIVEWHVAPGDAVGEDQVLVDVMTDKATVQVPSSVTGRVVALGGAVGDTVAVGSELIRIEVAGAAQTEAAALRPTAGAVPPIAPPVPSPVTRPVVSAVTPPPATAAAAPAAARMSAPAPIPPAPPSTRVRVLASPALRARAWELGVDLAGVAGTGAAGRITQADLDAHVARHPPAGRAGAAAPAAAPRPALAASPAAAASVTEVKIAGLRRRIAQKMMDAKRRIPHFAYVEEVDVTELEATRAVLNEEGAAAGRARLTLLPFLVRAIALAVREHPQVNALFDDEAGVLRQHAAVHVGIATQTPAGLMVPVLRDAGARDLWAIGTEIVRLADAARSGRATRDELAGSTITVSSLGRQGGIVTTPIINAPEVAIVGVNRIVEKPVLRDGAVVVRKTMNLSSSFDHRIVDGAVAADFVQALRRRLERPALLFAA
jgi:2-oxoisovalerate dehydrogenase E2 component (dihydrolipoyl transacylase)